MLPAAASPAQRFSVADRLANEIARRKESYRVAGHRLPALALHLYCITNRIVSEVLRRSVTQWHLSICT
jgi:hypothetical protein